MSRLDTMMATAARHDLGKQDQHQLAQAMIYNKDGEIVLPGDGLFTTEQSLPLTPWARYQICQRLNIPYRYLKRCPGFVQAQNFNYWQRQLPADKQWLIRSYAGRARAVLSDQYSIVNNSTVLQTIQELLANVDFELVRPYLDVDQLHLKLTTNQTHDGNYRIGCYVSNNEIGGGAIIVAPFVQRTICTNSIIHVDGGVRRAHFRLQPGFLRALLKHEIGSALQASSQMLDNIVAAEAENIPDIGDIVADIGKRKGFSNQIQADILMGTEGARTRMGLVNGLSFAAHASEDLPVETRLGLEILAGALLQTEKPVRQVVGATERMMHLEESIMT
ncbi:MAG: hypothetical protein KDE09_24700 [Anaerolineales bacterium]|nr:hypothetical protein [Anaerolineales bacterium]